MHTIKPWFGPIFAGAFLLAINAHAIDTEILGSPQKSEQPVPRTEDASQSEGPEQYWEEFSLRLKGMRTYSAYEATAGGRVGSRPGTAEFNPSLSATGGYSYGAEVRFRPNSSWYSFFGRAQYGTTTYSDNAQFTPNDLKITTKNFALGAVLYPFARIGVVGAALENLGLGFGWNFKTRDTTETRPDTVVTKLNRSGPILRIVDTFDLGGDFEFEPIAELFFPNNYYEDSRFTGIYKSSWTWDLSASIIYRLNDAFALSLGVYYQREYATFQGSGSRSGAGQNTDSSEKNYAIGIPLELRVSF